MPPRLFLTRFPSETNGILGPAVSTVAEGAVGTWRHPEPKSHPGAHPVGDGSGYTEIGSSVLFCLGRPPRLRSSGTEHGSELGPSKQCKDPRRRASPAQDSGKRRSVAVFPAAGLSKNSAS
jgi:hypothetical protein